jgi:hypothetical protein
MVVDSNKDIPVEEVKQEKQGNNKEERRNLIETDTSFIGAIR